MKYINTVLWDADGVIFDSAETNFKFFCKICEDFGKKQPYKTINEWKQNLHENWKVNYWRVGFNGEELGQVRERFKEFTKTQKYPLNKGVRDLVVGLNHKDTIQTIVSSSHTEIIERNLGSLLENFAFIIDFDSVKKIKPNPEALFKSLELTKNSSNEAIYLGDMTADIIAAYNAKIDCVIHTNGLHGREKLEQAAQKYGNCTLVDSIREIGEILL